MEGGPEDEAICIAQWQSTQFREQSVVGSGPT